MSESENAIGSGVTTNARTRPGRAALLGLAALGLVACGGGSVDNTGDTSNAGAGAGQGGSLAGQAGASAGQGGSATAGQGGAGQGGSPVGVSQVVAGQGHSCALLDDGRIKCWGDNSLGELGLGDTLTRGDKPGEMGDALPSVDLGDGVVPVKLVALASSTCALLSDGRVKCWGDNQYGQLGIEDSLARGDHPGEMGNALPFANMGATVAQLTGGQAHVCALLTDGLVNCWGYNQYGQLGLGDTKNRGGQPGQMGDALPAVDLGTNIQVTSLTAGFDHTCALFDDGRVKCWGGVSGLGDAKNRGSKPGEMGDALPFVDLGTGVRVIELVAGEGYNCALLDDGRVKCWGADANGRLGLGDTLNRGDVPGEMGDALPFVDLGTGVKVAHLGSNYAHTCALLTDGRSKCWGLNQEGQLGFAGPEAVGNIPGEMGDALPLVDPGAGLQVSGLSIGGFSSCAVLGNHRLKCWGANMSGQLGLGDTENRGGQPGDMGDGLPFVDLGSKQ